MEDLWLGSARFRNLPSCNIYDLLDEVGPQLIQGARTRYEGQGRVSHVVISSGV